MSVSYRWLLELEGVGPTLRWSDADVTVLDSDGREYAYRAGLEDLEVAAGDLEIDIGVTDLTDWPTLAPLMRVATCTLRRWRVGAPIEAAELYARGRVGELEHGAIGEPASWTIIDEEQAPAPPVPDLAAKVIETITGFLDGTWTDGVPTGFLVNESARGQFYPIVFGHPGEDELYAALNNPPAARVPAPHPRMIDDPPPASYALEGWFVVSEDPTTCNPSQVLLRADSEDGGIYEDLVDCVTVQDGLGRTIVMAIGADPTHTRYIIPSPESRVLVGYYATTPGIRRLDEVIAYALRRWAVDSTDWARIGETAELLNQFAADTWITESIDGGIWTWIEGLIEHLPVRIRTSQRGRYFVQHRVQTDPGRTRVSLVADVGGVSRVSPVQWTTLLGPYSELVVRYYDPTIPLLTFGPSIEGDKVVHEALVRAASLGVTRSQTIELPWTWDRPTAMRTGEYQIERDAMPHREVSYLVPERLGLVEGDQVEIEDPAIGLAAGTLALVDEPPLVGAGGATILLRVPREW